VLPRAIDDGPQSQVVDEAVNVGAVNVLGRCGVHELAFATCNRLGQRATSCRLSISVGDAADVAFPAHGFHNKFRKSTVDIIAASTFFGNAMRLTFLHLA